MNPLVLVLLALLGYLGASIFSFYGREHEQETLKLSGLVSAFSAFLGLLAGLTTITSGNISLMTNHWASMDMLSALMVCVISIVTIASSIYSINYLQEYLGKGGWKISVLM